VLFLLPPSETKAKGGGAITITQAATTFGALNVAREQVLSALGQPDLLGAPTMPAIERYTGTLYGAIHGRGLKGSGTENNTLTAAELKRAKELVLIQSALFGLIGALDLIPEYKISPSKLLNGVNLKKHWNVAHEKVWPRISSGPIIDLRSKAYADLAVIPEGIDAYSVEVFLEHADGAREQLNHFNKKAKGQLIRAALQASKPPSSIKELQNCAAAAGLGLEKHANQLSLITFG
jgi:cytoplasmic iron level regulating protein YaaA (DUF328/UPF0246 family)